VIESLPVTAELPAMRAKAISETDLGASCSVPFIHVVLGERM
jgi:hypothetical protein